jgi:hypothetical protein
VVVGVGVEVRRPRLAAAHDVVLQVLESVVEVGQARGFLDLPADEERVLGEGEVPVLPAGVVLDELRQVGGGEEAPRGRAMTCCFGGYESATPRAYVTLCE